MIVSYKCCLFRIWGPPGAWGPGAWATMAPLLICYWLCRPISKKWKKTECSRFRNTELIFSEIHCDNVGYDILCDIVVMLCVLSSYHSYEILFVEMLCVLISVLASYVYAFSEPN